MKKKNATKLQLSNNIRLNINFKINNNAQKISKILTTNT